MTIIPPDFPEQERMKALIEQLDSYISHYHGGGVELISYEGNMVKVRLGGACLGCPLSPVTLHGWVEGTIHQFFPEIQVIEVK
jgi:Fe-S cluster biogenesis protein NfuA